MGLYVNTHRMVLTAVLVLASVNITQAGKYNNKPSKAHDINAQIRALRSYRRLTPQQHAQLQELLAQKSGNRSAKGTQPNRYVQGAAPRYISI